jgi:hypothetical protein
VSGIEIGRERGREGDRERCDYSAHCRELSCDKKYTQKRTGKGK